MNVVEIYPVVIEQWKLEGFEKFMGRNSGHMNYELGLSRADIIDRCFYFLVRVRRVYDNEFNGEVFLGVTSTTFKIAYDYMDSPSISFLFDLINRATYDFAEVFHYRKQQTNLLHHKIEKPVLKEIENTILGIINLWDQPKQSFKEEFGKRLTSFKHLPSIPAHKLYSKNEGTTLEQRISHKLLTGKKVDNDERKIFGELADFYRKLNENLTSLDYSSFTTQDIKDFKNYLSYAFNYTPLLTNELTIYKVYRLVINENVSGSNNTLTETRFLNYPDLELVKRFGKFNRANTCDTTVLYTAESIDTALKEIRPGKNKRVTVGVWLPKTQRTFTCYPIVHSENAIKINESIANANRSIKQLEENYDPLFVEYMNHFLKLLSSEYSKRVKHHLEYMISAIFSERIFESDNGHPNFDFTCILYPSVGDNFQTQNIAIKSSVVEEYFVLDKVIEFIISDCFYDQTPNTTGNPENISLANVSYYRETSQLSNDGVIEWLNYINE